MKDAAASLVMDWLKERERVVQLMTQIFRLPVQRLWEPPIVDANLTK